MVDEDLGREGRWLTQLERGGVQDAGGDLAERQGVPFLSDPKTRPRLPSPREPRHKIGTTHPRKKKASVPAASTLQAAGTAGARLPCPPLFLSGGSEDLLSRG